MKRGSTLRKLYVYLRRYMGSIILSVLMSLIAVIMTLLLPILIGDAVDGIVGWGNVRWDEMAGILIRITVAATLGALATYIMNRCNNRICFRVTADIRRDVMDVLERAPAEVLDTHPHGDIVSRVIADADAVSDGLLMGFSSLFTGVITILLTLVIMFLVSAWVAAIVVVVTPVSLLVARFIARRSHTSFAAQSKDRGEQTSVVTEVCENIPVIRAFQREEAWISAFDRTAEKLKEDSLKAVFFSSITNPSTRFVNSIVYAAVGVCGAITAVNGGITVGMLSAFLGYANQYTKPFNEISGVVAELQNAFVSAARLFEMTEQVTEDSEDSDIVLTDTDGRVTMENVFFSYDREGKQNPEKALIRDLNIDVSPGSVIAIVGPTGAGKSTLINLLMRFYDADRGAIRVSGRNVRDVSRQSLRRQYGMVLQDTWIRTGTIRENIAFGWPEATDEEIRSAALAAHAHGFISRLPHGYDTIVSDQTGLSAGERQLICIARVMLHLPPMLILDEATSSIDTRTEMLIRSAFDRMMQGRTSFIVAHRLQTITGADRILVMKDGRVIEQGNHTELLKQDGFYADMYRNIQTERDTGGSE